MIDPAINGPTEAMNMIEANTIIQTTMGISVIRIPGARAFIEVVTKLIPPIRKATNSRATAINQSEAPQSVKLYSATADKGG